MAAARFQLVEKLKMPNTVSADIGFGDFGLVVVIHCCYSSVDMRWYHVVTGLFAPKTIRSLDFSLLGTFAPWNFRSALRVFVRDNICL